MNSVALFGSHVKHSAIELFTFVEFELINT